MKRILLLALLTIAFVVPLNSEASNTQFATERTFMYEAPASGSNASFFDLSKTLYLPCYSSEWGKHNDATYGTYSNENYVGQLGCAFTNHNIVFTIETDGRFTSQSDSTKYREFYIALVPRIRASSSEITDYKNNGSENNYKLGSGGSYVDESDRVPNSLDSGNITFIAPSFTVDDNYINIGAGTNMKYVSRFWFDVLVCMEELSAADLQHLAENDDYVAKVDISWQCDGTDCSKSVHSGTYTLILHGYYGSKDSSTSSMTMYVNPTADSMSLDLSTILASSDDSDRVRKISDLNVYCSSSSTNWADRLFIFASTSSSYSTAGSQFQLEGVSDSSKTIPFTIIVKDDETVLGTFDGTGYFTKNSADCLDMSDYVQYSQGRMLENAYSVVMESEVYLDFNTGTDTAELLSSLPSDVYQENIYYHIVYADSTLN